VDFDEYARTAVDIVNAPRAAMADLTVLFGGHDGMAEEATDRDLAAIRRAQKRLREVFEHGSAGRDAAAVGGLNTLLEAYPIQPRISTHDSVDWHMHVTGRGSAVSAEYLAGAVWGLAAWLCEHGSSRFGVCADERCGNVYLDTSSNCCRRFCSERCATRSHVAAHRARKRAAGSEPDSTSGRRADRPVLIRQRQVETGEGQRVGQIRLPFGPAGRATGGDLDGDAAAVPPARQ
jgi:predicted RNA-binding Zn ribbon-like protein